MTELSVDPAFSVEQIARIAHETNRAYCATIGDDSQPTWEDAPPWQRLSAVRGVQFHLNAHGRGEEPAPATSHEAWLKDKIAEGWRLGPVKDAEKKEHPCILPYAELPVAQRMKDYLFAHVVAAFVAGNTETFKATGFRPTAYPRESV